MTVHPASVRILDAAARLFAERGYQATTTRQIADLAEVNEVTLFRGFGNKQGVLAAVVERVVAEMPGRAAPDLSGLPLREAVTEMANLFAGGPQANLAAVAAFFADRQRAGQVRTDLAAETIAEAFFGLTSSFVIMRTVLGFEAGSDQEVRQAVAALVEVLLTGAEGQR